jgi:hypothetical protein
VLPPLPSFADLERSLKNDMTTLVADTESLQGEKMNLHKQSPNDVLENSITSISEEVSLTGWRLVAVASSVILSIFLV